MKGVWRGDVVVVADKQENGTSTSKVEETGVKVNFRRLAQQRLPRLGTEYY